MKSSLFYLMLLMSIGNLTGCGVMVESSETHNHPAYVKYSIYEEDHFIETVDPIASECIVIDDSSTEETVVVDNDHFDEIKLKWQFDDDKIVFKFEQDDEELSKTYYDTDLFRGGYSNKQTFSTHQGTSYVVVVSGPSCG